MNIIFRAMHVTMTYLNFLTFILAVNKTQRIKFSIKDFSVNVTKSAVENFFFCAVRYQTRICNPVERLRLSFFANILHG